MRGLNLRLLGNLRNAGRLGRLRLARGQSHGVEVTLVRSRETPVLTRRLLTGQTRTNRSVLSRNLGGPGDFDGLARILGDKLLDGKVVVKCDASKKANRVLFEGRSEEVHFGCKCFALEDTYAGLRQLFVS